jgi:methionine aminopeptidase
MNEYYNVGTKIAKKVYESIVKHIENGERSVHTLRTMGDKMIELECEKVYKKVKNKGIGFPVCILLNNYIGNKLENSNLINEEDVVKIELGVNICGCIAMYGDTFLLKKNDVHEKYINLLNNLQKKIIKLMKHGETNDEVRINVESICTESGCVPVENTVNYQNLEGQLKTMESKYIIFNYKKHYDMDDNLTTEVNDCYEFEKGEVYTLSLKIHEDKDVKYKREERFDIYRFNDCYYNLKLKSSREFLTKVKSKVENCAFELSKFLTSVKDKFGFKECVVNGILEEYPVTYVDNKNIVVYSKVFTVIIS